MVFGRSVRNSTCTGHLVGRERFCRQNARSSASVGLCAGAHDDPRLDDLAFDIVGHAGDADFRDRRMRGEHLFDLARPHLIAARLDQILLPIDDEQDSRPRRDIPGRRCAASASPSVAAPLPVIAQTLGGLVRRGSSTRSSAAVRAEAISPTSPAGSSRTLVRIEDRDRRRPAAACRPIRSCSTPFTRVHAQRHHRFGQRVAFDDAAAGERFERALGVGHQRRRAGEADAGST